MSTNEASIRSKSKRIRGENWRMNVSRDAVRVTRIRWARIDHREAAVLAQETETGGNKGQANRPGIPRGMLPGQIARVLAIVRPATNIVTFLFWQRGKERKRKGTAQCTVPRLVFDLRAPWADRLGPSHTIPWTPSPSPVARDNEERSRQVHVELAGRSRASASTRVSNNWLLRARESFFFFFPFFFLFGFFLLLGPPRM
mgnify:CR=1 FL=1